ncbi:MAG: superoxide dismutase family protein [Flavobacteriaceae bacterium]|nr:superoxide dismutase family protein [Flavobacteriaceae bacterium]
MKTLKLCLLATMIITLAACKNDAKKQTIEEEVEKVVEEVTEEVKVISMALESKSGSSATGKIMFTEKDGEVTMEARISGLSPGTHAIHIHEQADCSAEDASSSGGHWNPTFANHGAWGAEAGYHRGDIGNFEADDSGSGGITFSTNEWCLGCDDDKKNIIGKAIIVHQGADDFTSQPSGAAGARVSCGGIIE